MTETIWAFKPKIFIIQPSTDGFVDPWTTQLLISINWKKNQLKQYYDLGIISHPSIHPSIHPYPVSWPLFDVARLACLYPVAGLWGWLGCRGPQSQRQVSTFTHQDTRAVVGSAADVGSTWAKLASGAGPFRWWAFGGNHIYTKLSHTQYRLLRMALLELSITTPPACRPRNQELEKWLAQGKGKMQARLFSVGAGDPAGVTCGLNSFSAEDLRSRQGRSGPWARAPGPPSHLAPPQLSSQQGLQMWAGQCGNAASQQ